MKKLKNIYLNLEELKEVDFGYVKLKLRDYLDSKDITRNQLSIKTGIKYQTIDRYYKNDTVDRVDLVLMAKICYVLGCEISDILEYIKK